MKGTILDFSIQTSTGVISGDDARRLHDTNRSGWWYLMSLHLSYGLRHPDTQRQATDSR